MQTENHNHRENLYPSGPWPGLRIVMTADRVVGQRENHPTRYGQEEAQRTVEQRLSVVTHEVHIGSGGTALKSHARACPLRHDPAGLIDRYHVHRLVNRNRQIRRVQEDPEPHENHAPAHISLLW